MSALSSGWSNPPGDLGSRVRLAAARRVAVVVVVAIASLLLTSTSVAAGPPVFVAIDGTVGHADAQRIHRHVARRRPVREPLPLPTHVSSTTDQQVLAHRERAIGLALERAKEREAEASFEECVKEAAAVLSDATEVLAETGRLGLLRELHVQIGSCMVLGPNPANARPHFLAATLLDESPPRRGLHREEAEAAHADVRSEVLRRSRGKVRIETTPSGADVWIDGREARGKTPLTVEARLGDHFVTVRRFRFEPHTERVVLQPSGVVRITLDPAPRSTLRRQLMLPARGGAGAPLPGEHQLAHAVWSRAEQVLVVSRTRGPRPAIELRLLDAASGRRIRRASIASVDDEAVREGVCRVLGERCRAPSGGVPWYVWPLAGAVVVGGAVTTAVVADSNRDVRFCPRSGCR